MTLHLRLATPGDTPALAAILSGQSPQPITPDTFAAEDAQRPADRPFLRLVAEDDGQVAGYAEAAHGVEMEPGHYFLRVRVDHAWRGRSIGHLLHGAVAAWSEVKGATLLTSSVVDTDVASLKWAEQEGYRRVSHVLESELDLSAWDPAPFTPRLREPVRFSTLADEMQATDQAMLAGGRQSGDPEERALRRFHAFCVASERDIPGRGPRTPAYETWRRAVLPDLNPAGVILALVGDQWAALSQVTGRGPTLYHALTAVHPKFRGQRFSLAVKVEALNYAKAQGARAIRTHNHEANAPLLAVNRKLGFRPRQGLIQLDYATR